MVGRKKERAGRLVALPTRDDELRLRRSAVGIVGGDEGRQRTAGMSGEPDPFRVHAAREAVLSVAGEVEERVDDERHVARLRQDVGNRRPARRAEAGEWERGGRHDVAGLARCVVRNIYWVL